MSYISLKLQDKNNVLKLIKKLTHEWCMQQQGPKQECKIEISIKTFGYSVKFDVLKKKREQINGFYRYVIL